MSKKIVARVFDLDPALQCIAQCIAAPRDVLTFLSAFPTLPTPLTALRQLLSNPLAAILVLDAMPVFPALQVDNPYTWWLGDPRSLDDFAQLVDAWGEKLTHLRLCHVSVEADLPILIALLERCTRLEVVRVENVHDKDLVAAVTSAGHCVRHLDIKTTYRHDAEVEWAERLRPWLRSGYASHLGFADADEDGRDVARVLADASSLSSLDLTIWSMPPVQDAEPRLENVTKVRVLDFSTDGLFTSWLFGRLYLGSLVSISFACDSVVSVDFSDIFSALPLLQELEVCNAHIVHVEPPPAVISTALRRVAFINVGFFLASLDALVACISHSPVLETLTWSDSTSCAPVIVDAFVTFGSQWVGQGVREVDLVNHAIGNKEASSLAVALCGASSPTGCRFDLTQNHIGEEGYVALLDALTTCTRVTLWLDPNWAPLAAEAATRNLVVQDMVIWHYPVLGVPNPVVCVSSQSTLG
ncbi:hypothetical protein SPRG_10604 [Saprolegnia parasitica CBS 223.65]|uniref:Uncharacterized protein n=1 Tax=Saprolegnia parasitica (strain CBS 223.65) TaxID=695850 RepID=A0A067CCF1_SAPPC|nr:hypothetical protein SPRG_10604 [Saprolegnia parasitica CBS 223.65]KDO24176.1 hypothetical protein SPRG_10604 [Saprolegnia parasitica CBS 223.65]|eukprot:XP_012205120.1 hypothetical protein SPRG_10604 [Saprolegnia parasitica CBS 223.65]